MLARHQRSPPTCYALTELGAPEASWPLLGLRKTRHNYQNNLDRRVLQNLDHLFLDLFHYLFRIS